ncbi:3-hydroxyisobutyrate dehydrogenase [Dietzia sp. NCCP-2495]|uniref:3-hydroxyisobutyrate dehydrogenase n=1 Tax=Dietzia sp. NCCP-2495 TaxID=2934675 RepID=UPI00222E9FDA|nr:3-hydroxyisobutyrate dehydrogenase [Dietzia sp. NCCP-2495]GLB65415.1 3-hydroxyisobutyrate dehydrogenase [Dietzia sp. NCCP-2495]
MTNGSQTIAFLGLGNMGGPMAANLAKAGNEVRGFDPVEAAQDAARQAGVTVCESPAQAVEGASVVITMLPNGALVTSTYSEVLSSAEKGTLFIDSSTISVDDARAVHAQAVDAGMLQVDAPVSGGVKGATAGTLAFMVGGEDEAFAAAQPVLEPMAGKIIHCGGTGAGQAAKVCNNMVLAVHQIAIGEAFVLAERLGLSHQALHDVVTGATGNSWALHTNCPVPGPVPTSPANNDFAPGFATALMNKDLGLALAALESTGTVAPLGAAAAALYDEFAQDNGDKDFSAIITSIRASAGN